MNKPKKPGVVLRDEIQAKPYHTLGMRRNFTRVQYSA